MKISIKILAIVSVLFFTACESWLDVQQEGEIESGPLFEKGEGFRAVLNGLYKGMGATTLYGRDLSYGMVDCMSQQYDLDYEQANDDETYQNFYHFNYTTLNNRDKIDATWLAAFKVIANANDLIQNAANASPDIFEEGEMERKLILGEAYACRALMHFDMLRLFAPAPVNDDKQTYVPYVESYPEILATSMQVTPFLEKVIGDLIEARNLVREYDTSAAGVKASATVAARTSLSGTVSEYGDFFYGRLYRLNYYSITALLARVYQYAGKQEEAFNCAKEVVEFGTANGGNAFYVDDFTGVKSTDGEAPELFESGSDYKVKSNIIFSAYDKKMYDDAYFKQAFRSEMGQSISANVYFVLKRAELFKSRGVDEWTTDVRSTNMILAAQGQFHISGKWFIPSTNPEGSEHLKMSPVIRLTEMRYIMAEYYARENQFDKAYDILNDIRAKRSLQQPLSVQNSFAEFVTDLIEDARREWISEGQLFYLYKRLDAPFMKNNESHKLTKAEACLPLPADQK